MSWRSMEIKREEITMKTSRSFGRFFHTCRQPAGIKVTFSLLYSGLQKKLRYAWEHSVWMIIVSP